MGSTHPRLVVKTQLNVMFFGTVTVVVSGMPHITCMHVRTHTYMHKSVCLNSPRD